MNRTFLNQTFPILLLLAHSYSCTEGTADKSLRIDEYRELGVPDPGRKWNLDDYNQAYNVFARRKWEHPLELPAKDSEKSGVLFERMVSMECLSFLHDSAISLNEKAERISEFTRVYDYWMDIYTNPALKQNYYSREIIDIQIFNLRLTEAMVDLAHQINISNKPEDIGLRYGFGAIKENYLTCLNNDLKTQSHSALFARQDLERMADSIFNSVMRNKEWMDSSTVNELKVSLHLVIDSTSSDYIRNKYKNLERFLSI